MLNFCDVVVKFGSSWDDFAGEDVGGPLRGGGEESIGNWGNILLVLLEGANEYDEGSWVLNGLNLSWRVG